LSDASVQRRFENILPRVRQPARLIGGEPGAGRGFRAGADEFRVVLGFPDTYEIGISNQAIQILYYLAVQIEGVAVERTYLPWVDAISEMRRERIPLLTLETWTPVADADLLGFTLQHELGYTNLLEMLDLAGIPLHAKDRTNRHPLVLAGGPASANFVPMSRFLDGVAVGDGEELFPEILRVLAAAKLEGVTRSESRSRLSKVKGVFVPGLSEEVVRRSVVRIEDSPYPEACLIPLTAGVHDRAWVEIMRGCTRGCRFCQAGMWYRPVRERSPGMVLRMAEAQLLSSGHEEVAFASLSTTDYSCLEAVLARTAKSHPEVRVSLPSLRVDGAAVKLARLASPTGPSLTLAPEAGSQRMRDVINKNVTEVDVLGAVEEAFRAGRTTLKLYFMIGLPTEEDADAVAIADLCLKVRERGRSILGSRAGRLQLNISVNNFVPKPFTPFQWAGMADRRTLIHRQELLRARLRRPGIRLALSGVDTSYLEAVLARGSESLGAVVEEAWSRGARFDSWTEEFQGQAWRAAFESGGTTAEGLATASLSPDQPLPWDFVSGVVERDFLWMEWEKARRAEVTPDCRWSGCSDCGVCRGCLANDLAETLAEAPISSEGPPVARADSAAGEELVTGGALADLDGKRWRYAATFSVTGRQRFLGHLDRTEVFRRAVRRAGGRLALSSGMRPKPLLSLALPLAVGVEGLEELAEFELAEEADPGLFGRLAASLPENMRLLSLASYEERRSLAARIVGASYEVQVKAVAHRSDMPEQARAARPNLTSTLGDAAARFRESSELPVQEKREGGIRRVDVKEYVDSVSVEKGPGSAATLSFRVKISPSGSTRPERVVQALEALTGSELAIAGVTRTRIHVS
jgi:radical SAM-linked protein